MLLLLLIKSLYYKCGGPYNYDDFLESMRNPNMVMRIFKDFFRN